jgi:hypothetical protein
LGGGLLTPDSILPGATVKKTLGSTLLIRADNIEEVKEMIYSDIYYTSGVVSVSAVC